MGLSAQMVKEQDPGLACQVSRWEIVLHQHEDIDIIGFGLARDEGSKDDESRQMTGCQRKGVHANQSSDRGHTPACTLSEALHYFLQSSTMDSQRQVTTLCQI